MLWALGLAPLAVLIARFFADTLGANPIEEITHETGKWTLRLLVLTLAVTPARRLFGWSWLAPHRRTLGLLAFTYGCMHFATYAVLDLGLELGDVVEDVVERPYITVGFASFVGMLSLALTSTRGWQKRLGRRWVYLHRIVYAVAIGGVLHFLWLVKADLLEPLVYGAIVALLLLARAWPRIVRRVRSAQRI